MANRQERRKAEAIRKKNSAKAERQLQLEEMARRARRTAAAGATIGERPDARADEPHRPEIQ